MHIFEVSLLSADLGMDIRDTGSVFTLPVSNFYKVKYDDRKNRQLMTQGDWNYVSSTLEKAGYRVEQDREQNEYLQNNLKDEKSGRN